MQSPSPSPAPPTSATVVPPPWPGGGGSGKIATALAAVALAVAVVAVGLNFVVAGPSTARTATGVPLWAVVAENGTLARGSGVLNVTLSRSGDYNVTFVRSLSGCSFAATLGTTAAGLEPPGSAVVTVMTKSISEVAVATFNSTAAQTDESFHLVALCPNTAPEIQFWAIVASDGDLVSGSPHSNSSGSETVGVEFGQSVTNCAFIAGLGESTSGTPPAGFVTVARLFASANGVFVETYDSSGDYSAEPFHLEVYC